MLTKSSIVALAFLASCASPPPEPLSSAPPEALTEAVLVEAVEDIDDCCTNTMTWYGQGYKRIYVRNNDTSDISDALLSIRLVHTGSDEHRDFYVSELYTYYDADGRGHWRLLHQPDPDEQELPCTYSVFGCLQLNTYMCFHEVSTNPFNGRTTRTRWCDMHDVVTGLGIGHVTCLSDWCRGLTWTVYTDEHPPPG